MKQAFKDINLKLSIKRVTGFGGSVICFAMFIMRVWYPEISETLIITMTTASFGLLGSTLAEKKNINNDSPGL